MKNQSSKATKREKIERPTKASDIEKEEMAVLRSVVAAAQVDDHRDEFEVFGELVARKMRKLSHVIDEDAMELVEHNINTVLMNARGNHVRNGAPYYTPKYTPPLSRYNVPTVIFTVHEAIWGITGILALSQIVMEYNRC